MKDLSSDWRLTNQMKYLKGVNLVFKPYKMKSEKWDHDHCEFCSAKFMEPPHEALYEGYTTEDNYRWICKDCFNDFKDLFEWKVNPAF